MSNEGWSPGDRVIVTHDDLRTPATVHDSRGAGPLEHSDMVLVEMPEIGVTLPDGESWWQPAGLYWVDPERVSRAEK